MKRCLTNFSIVFRRHLSILLLSLGYVILSIYINFIFSSMIGCVAAAYGMMCSFLFISPTKLMLFMFKAIMLITVPGGNGWSA